MTHRFAVTVAKEYLTFSAAHFITIPGHQCERMHGHNYRVGVRVTGAVDEATGFVVDFGVIKQVVRPLIEAVDHRVLLPAANPVLAYRTEGEHTLVTYRGVHQFTLPSAHVVMLPVADTTAERLAAYFAERVGNALRLGGADLGELRVEVEESVGQSASFTVELGPQ